MPLASVVGQQQQQQALRSQWIRGGEGFLILYSITDRSSFEEVETFRKQILQVKDVNDCDAPPMGSYNPLSPSLLHISSSSSSSSSTIFVQPLKTLLPCCWVRTVLVGNKSDLEAERQVKREVAQNLAAVWKCPFFEASAKTRSNVDESFFTVVRAIRKIEGGPAQAAAAAPKPKPKKGGCLLF